ncbi:hypothetical protein ABC329_17275 [Vibrio cholerae]|nr:hypothetical protein [Vibrio cholerae]MDV2301375.1 hypothetical protein [Vibrio cholerae]
MAAHVTAFGAGCAFSGCFCVKSLSSKSV